MRDGDGLQCGRPGWQAGAKHSAEAMWLETIHGPIGRCAVAQRSRVASERGLLCRCLLVRLSGRNATQI